MSLKTEEKEEEEKTKGLERSLEQALFHLSFISRSRLFPQKKFARLSSPRSPIRENSAKRKGAYDEPPRERGVLYSGMGRQRAKRERSLSTLVHGPPMPARLLGLRRISHGDPPSPIHSLSSSAKSSLAKCTAPRDLSRSQRLTATERRGTMHPPPSGIGEPSTFRAIHRSTRRESIHRSRMHSFAHRKCPPSMTILRRAPRRSAGGCA